MNGGHASFTHLVLDADSIPPFDEKMSKLRLKQKENSMENADGGSIADFQETTLDLRIQISRDDDP